MAHANYTGTIRLHRGCRCVLSYELANTWNGHRNYAIMIMMENSLAVYSTVMLQ